MNVVDTEYRLSKRLMKIIGVWPYDNPTFRRIKCVFANIMISSLVVVQLKPVLTDDIGTIELLQRVCYLLMFVGPQVKLIAFTYNVGAIKVLMDGIRTTWDTEVGDTLAILKRRAVTGRLQGVLYAICIYPAVLVMAVFRTSSFFVIISAPPEANLTDVFPLVTNYFIDEDKYFPYIVLHQDITFLLCTTTYVAGESVYCMWLQHGISLMEFASYYFEKAISDRPDDVSQELEEAYRHKCLANGVKHHNEGKVFLAYLQSALTSSYSLLLVLAVVTMAINFFCLSDAICVTHSVEDALRALSSSATTLGYLFFIHYLMEGVVEYAAEIPAIVYSTPWYNMSIPIQKKLLLILRNSSQPIVFGFYGFHTASVEGFSKLLKASVSYFMMITSLQDV